MWETERNNHFLFTRRKILWEIFLSALHRRGNSWDQTETFCLSQLLRFFLLQVILYWTAALLLLLLSDRQLVVLNALLHEKWSSSRLTCSDSSLCSDHENLRRLNETVMWAWICRGCWSPAVSRWVSVGVSCRFFPDWNKRGARGVRRSVNTCCELSTLLEFVSDHDQNSATRNKSTAWSWRRRCCRLAHRVQQLPTFSHTGHLLCNHVSLSLQYICLKTSLC